MIKKSSDVPVMHQDWRNLLFLHWKYPSEEIQKTLPPGLYADTFEGSAYLTVSPFMFKNLRIANFPSIPGFSNFIEVNFRTYVVDKNGIHGIWFYSLDLNSYFGEKAARAAYALPYFFANLNKQLIDDEILLEGYRIGDSTVKMQFSYRPNSLETTFAKQGSLDYFLIERYVLFSFSSNELSLARVYHKPYPLQNVEIIKFHQGLDKPCGFKLAAEPNYIHYSPGIDVDISKLKKSKI